MLAHYGNGRAACVVCGEARLACLSIDHLNNNGYAHRKITGNGQRLYWWLKRNKLPEGFQTLCMNCQFVKREQERECMGPLKYIRTSAASGQAS